MSTNTYRKNKLNFNISNGNVFSPLAVWGAPIAFCDAVEVGAWLMQRYRADSNGTARGGHHSACTAPTTRTETRALRSPKVKPLKFE